MNARADGSGAGDSVVGSTACVLVVDDDVHFRNAIKRGLLGQGYRVATAGSAEDALEVLGGMAVDVVVTDLRMDGQTGLDLIRALGTHYPRTRSILMSGDLQAPERDEALALGAASVLHKPFSPLELASAVNAALARSS